MSLLKTMLWQTYTHTHFCLNVSFWWTHGSNGMYLNFYVYYKIYLIYIATICMYIHAYLSILLLVLDIVNPLTLSNLIRETFHLNVSCIYILLWGNYVSFLLSFFSFFSSLPPSCLIFLSLWKQLCHLHNNLSPELKWHLYIIRLLKILRCV